MMATCQLIGPGGVGTLGAVSGTSKCDFATKHTLIVNMQPIYSQIDNMQPI